VYFLYRDFMAVAGSSHHLIGLEQERRGEREPEGVRRLEVEDQLTCRRLLPRQVGGFGALQEAIHTGGPAGRHVCEEARAMPHVPLCMAARALALRLCPLEPL